MQHPEQPDADLIGRDAELARLDGFIRGKAAERAAILVGPPGVGKTRVWEAAVASARAGGATVLLTRAVQAEQALTFAGLIDLLAGIDLDRVDILPPQRRALDVALLRTDAAGEPPQRHAVAQGLLQALRALSLSTTVIVAVDDLQWLDAGTEESLRFALRRLTESNVRLLAARRPGPRTAVEMDAGSTRTAVIELAGLSLGATRRLLADRLSLTLRRRLARDLLAATLGNPLFSLEIGRSIVDRGEPGIGEALRVPESIDDLIAERIGASPTAAGALLAVALAGPMTEPELERVVDAQAVHDAIQAGLLTHDGGHLRASHPLFAAAAIKQSARVDQRATHARLADASSDPVRHALHLAAATLTPDSEIARAVDLGAIEALKRGASVQAADLAERALRLTPPGDLLRDERVLTLGELLFRAEEATRLKALFDHELATLPPGERRARGHLLAAHGATSQADYDAHLEAALREAVDDDIRAQVLASQSIDATISWVDRFEAAETKAQAAIDLARDDDTKARARHAMAWVRLFQARSLGDLAPTTGSPDAHWAWWGSHARIEAIQAAFQGRIDAARAILEQLARQADERGDEDGHATYHHHLCEIEIRAGDCRRLATLIEEDYPDDEARIAMRSRIVRLRALLEATRGDQVAARGAAAAVFETIEGQRWDALDANRALGLAALAADDPAGAFPPLREVWMHMEREGIAELGAFPVANDLVEAALATGDRELAVRVTDRLRVLGTDPDHVWAHASALRCAALVSFAERGDDPEARADLVAAADQYLAAGARFDAARTLLALGRQARRARQWAVAREALDRSASILDALGCDGWATQARQLLAGLPGRRPSTGLLSPSERRVADLASRGLSNKEIATALFVTEHTVEVHLGHAYPKLGVRSRAELARVLDRQQPDDSVAKD